MSPATPGTPRAKTPQQPSTATTQNSSAVTFADTDDPKNKSGYGVDDGVFKPKKGKSAGGGGDEKPKEGAGSPKEKKKSKESDRKSSTKGKKDPSKKKNDKDKNKEKNKDNKNDDSDKTDLRSLTLEKNLAEAKDAKIKNPAAIDRSNRIIEGKDAGTTSGYALPMPKKDAQSSKDPKKNGSAYLN
uniref:Uncharacterized protein n=1 Tax=Panagrolaimus sp. ES5 TaxID=591445 RepID=A0AC34FRC5_9BILA